MQGKDLFRLLTEKKGKWLITFLFLTIIGFVSTIQSSIVLIQQKHAEIAYSNNLFFNLFYWWFWLFAIPLIIWLSKKFDFSKEKFISSSLLHIFAVILIILIHQLYTSAWCNYLFGQILYLPLFKKLIWRILNLEWIFVDFVVYFLFVIGYFALEYQKKLNENERKVLQLETRLAQAQLQALKMQLHPHFLFNTMNAISTLILKGEIKKANNMLVLFSDFLRMTLEETGSQTVPLQTELLFVERYLEVEKVRFQDKMNVVMEIQPSTTSLMVPNLILQPLIENAVKHAISKKTTDGFIYIVTKSIKSKLVIQIKDNGPGIKDISAFNLNNSGIGLKNTKERLSKLYGDKASIRFENINESGLLVTLELPVTGDDAITSDNEIIGETILPAYQI